MDGAKKNAEYVAQHLLPDRPYHLSLHHDRRYPKPEGFWFTGPSAALQYQTYLSDADRGVLFTLPPWAISEESSQTMPIAKSSESKGEAKKKLSVKEHLNRKKSPQSPLDNDLLPSGNKVVDGSSRTTNGNGSAVHARPVPPPSTTREPPKKDVAKSTADKSDARRPDSRNEKPRPEVNGERYDDNFLPCAKEGRAFAVTNKTPTGIEILFRNRCPSSTVENEQQMPMEIHKHKKDREMKLQTATRRWSCNHDSQGRNRRREGEIEQTRGEPIPRAICYIQQPTDWHRRRRIGIERIPHLQGQPSWSMEGRGYDRTAQHQHREKCRSCCHPCMPHSLITSPRRSRSRERRWPRKHHHLRRPRDPKAHHRKRRRGRYHHSCRPLFLLWSRQPWTKWQRRIRGAASRTAASHPILQAAPGKPSLSPLLHRSRFQNRR